MPRTLKPVPKKQTASSLNDYRPVALASVRMKVLEKLVLSCVKSLLTEWMDPYQFACRENRSTDDAVAITL